MDDMEEDFSTLKQFSELWKCDPKPPLDVLLPSLKAFCEMNEVPAHSPNFAAQDQEDDLDSLFAALGLGEALEESNSDFTATALKVAKILSRKEANRLALEAEHAESLAKHLGRPCSEAVACEACSVVLNMCYEKDNVETILEANAVAPLVTYLSSPDQTLQGNAAGAVQSISYQQLGREFLHDIGVIQPVVPLLKSNDAKVQTRAVGVIHNMSTDASTISDIRRADGIVPLISLLRSNNTGVCGSAAGALQNISRENASREIIRANDGVPPLIDLMMGNDVLSQVCSTGAVLNILGPELSDVPSHPRRVALRKLLTSSMVASLSYHGLFSPDSE